MSTSVFGAWYLIFGNTTTYIVVFILISILISFKLYS